MGVSSQYLHFTDSPSKSGKTVVSLVTSVSSGDLLGQVAWYGPWRQYCFYPASSTVWNVGCLEAVNTKIADLMMERRK